jgi:hypothetical protein
MVLKRLGGHMNKVFTSAMFDGLLADATRLQYGALSAAIGCIKAIPGCDAELLGAAQAELGRYRRELKQWSRREIEDFQSLDRLLLERAWADHRAAVLIAEQGWVDGRKPVESPLVLSAGDGYEVYWDAKAFGVTEGVVFKGGEVAGRVRVQGESVTWGRNRSADSVAAALRKIVESHQEVLDSTARAALAFGCPR